MFDGLSWLLAGQRWQLVAGQWCWPVVDRCRGAGSRPAPDVTQRGPRDQQTDWIRNSDHSPNLLQTASDDVDLLEICTGNLQSA